MIELLYTAWNRLEFTRKSFETMVANTDWSRVSRIVVYDDGSTDGTADYLVHALEQMPNRPETHFRATKGIGPVGIMRDFLRCGGAGIFAKVDNDVMLPPNWLGECLEVMEREPSVDLLGIEAMVPSGPRPRHTYQAEFIGGIGLMRRRVFNVLPEADGPRSRFGFTAWQTSRKNVNKAWLSPALPVSLLNLVPLEPWLSLSREYIAKGYQRDWPSPYLPARRDLWEWWAR